MENNITWLHLSDWHQKGDDFDRKTVCDALLEDIRKRAAISPALEKIDFMVFSGDVAFSGKAEEYQAAVENFFDPVLQAAGLTRDRLLIVPGNHDLDRDEFEFLPAALQQPLGDEKQVQKWLTHEKGRKGLLGPFDAYHDFVSKYLGKGQSAYISTRRFTAGGRQIGLLGLNSAWMCGRGKGEPEDYGVLIIGEPQADEGLKKIAAADLRIAVLHHSFEWLAEFDRVRVKEHLGQKCDFILCGHQHMPKVEVLAGGTSGNCVIIPAGACYERRVVSDARYANAYNLVHLDVVNNQGTVYPRRWSDRQKAWISDTDTIPKGVFSFSLPGRAVSPESPAPAAVYPENPLLREWLRALAGECARLPLGAVDPKFADPEIRVELPDVYTDLHVIRAPEGGEEKEGILLRMARGEGEREEVIEALERPENRLAVLLGDPGSGKSTLVNVMSYRLASSSSAKFVPVRLILRDADHAADGAYLLWDLLRRDMRLRLGDADGENLFADARDGLRQNGLFLLDGLDEVPEGRRKKVLQAVSALAGELEAGARVLVTARPYAYADAAARLPGFPILALAPLDRAQTKNFVHHWYRAMAPLMGWREEAARDRADELDRELAERTDLGDLASRPLLLTLTASLHTSRAKLPEDRAELYEESVHLLLYRWQKRLDEKKRDGAPLVDEQLARLLRLEDRALRVGLEELAYNTHLRQEQKHGAGDIFGDEVLAVFAKLLRNQNPVGVLEFLERRTGLLIGRGNGCFAFLHRSFQEYLAACRLAEISDDFGEVLAKHLKTDFSWWREVFLLGVGKARQGGMGNALGILNALLPEDAGRVREKTDVHWRAALAAGLGLLDLRTSERAPGNRTAQVLHARNAHWLAELVETGALSVRERAEAGDVLGRLGDPRPGMGLDEKGLPDIAWRDVPAGEFLMGSRKEDKEAYDPEKPLHSVVLPAFRISRYPVTNAQYRAFVDDKGYENRQWWDEAGWVWRQGVAADLSPIAEANENYKKQYRDWLAQRPKEKRSQPWFWNQPPQNLPNRPVVGLCWHEARAFCQWLSARMGRTVRLPVEAEWEKAARGTDGRYWPWGDVWEEGRANTEEAGLKTSCAVGLFPNGDSSYGLADCIGTVCEWTNTRWGRKGVKPDYLYPYDPKDGRENPQGPDLRIIRGGSFYHEQKVARCACRVRLFPVNYDENIGFRVVMSPANSEF
ncbi:MAG: SUMF1/EgtB/PvdO family nonheme iron enzyme [Gammaproteobacteria bacterium]|nr:SUMF1/EgtB/PvdO family nonheme iron enzyme [Gammaproteobacteria bacterium]